MENHNIENEVKSLVGEFKLEDALDLLIGEAKKQNERKENTLLILKGKLAMLNEQALAGMLDPAELARQKTVIAHQILDIADGSSLDLDAPVVEDEPQVVIQKTVQAPAGKSLQWTWVIIAVCLGLALFTVLLLRTSDDNKKETAQSVQDETRKSESSKPTDESPSSQDNRPEANQSNDKIKILDFPNLRQPFNFLDFKVEFTAVEAEWISDNEIKLSIRYQQSCRNNLGICYRQAIKIYADGKAIAPYEQSNTDGWVEKGASISDAIGFVLPAHAKEWMIELSREQSVWKRPFKLIYTQ